MKDIENKDEITSIAQKNFGIKYLYPWQRMVISNILDAYVFTKQYDELSNEEKLFFLEQGSDSFSLGKQIVLLPTGAGKSLCFQLPALMLDGPTMVIYPLLALMTDQERRMNEGALQCVTFRGGQSEKEQNEAIQKVKNGAQIILANPEVLQNDRLVNKLKTLKIRHLVIDEAHCVSEWGDSFRPAYLQLGNIIKKLTPDIVTAFTATASPLILERIKEILFDKVAHIVQSSSDRPNIHYYVMETANKSCKALQLTKNQDKPMIIFCGTRGNAEEMCKEINACYGKDISRFYHAGLEKSEKEECEKWFFNSKDGILCATCAYGMGVDKKDIHTVVHITPPSSIESYIQEAGRGGRDGSVAKAILLWSLADSLNYKKYEEGSREAQVLKFAQTKKCRRQVLLDALGGEQAVCSGCDLCDKSYVKSTTDYEYALKLIKKKNKFYTREDFEEALFENLNTNYRQEMEVNIYTHKDCTSMSEQLICSDYIEKDNLFWKNKLKLSKKV